MRPSDFIKQGWCQGASAKDLLGIVCPPSNPHATQWCTIGAIQAAYPEDEDKRAVTAERLRHTLRSDDPARTTSMSLAIWNDIPHRTQAEVITALQAIGE